MGNFFKGLGLGLLCLLFFVSGVVLNVLFLKPQNTDKLVIQRQIELSNELKPNIFNATLIFNASEVLSQKNTLNSEDKENIATLFKELTTLAQKNGICTGGAFSIEPTFLYQDGLQIPKGQRLEANFECKFNKDQFQTYNTFLKEIDQILQKNTLVSMNSPALKASVSSEILEQNQELLYKESLQKALNFEKQYSNILNRTCTLQNLTLNPQNPTFRNYENVALKADLSTMPITKDQIQSIKANISLICK